MVIKILLTDRSDRIENNKLKIWIASTIINLT